MCAVDVHAWPLLFGQSDTPWKDGREGEREVGVWMDLRAGGGLQEAFG